MKDLMVHFSRTYAAVNMTGDNGVSRNHSGRQMSAVLASMHDDDREMLVRFCAAVVEACSGNPKRLVEW